MTRAPRTGSRTLTVAATPAWRGAARVILTPVPPAATAALEVPILAGPAAAAINLTRTLRSHP